MTRQIRDKLIYQNKQYYLNDELLEKYFRNYPEKKPENMGIMTACWRGYVATYEIKNQELCIKEIDWLFLDENETNAHKLPFAPNEKFSWFSGLIRIDDYRGEFDDEPKDGLFEFLEIKNGDFIQKREMNYDALQKFKKEQYGYFILSDDVNPIYALFKKNNEAITEERVNEIIADRILLYSREIYVDD